MKNIQLILISLIVVILLSGCFGKKKEKMESDGPKFVKVFTVGAHDQIIYKYPATVEASARADLAFEVPGLLMEVSVKGGDKIKEGQVLAKLDPTVYKIAVAKAKAQFEKAQAEVDRNQLLAEKQYISKSSYEKIIANRDMAKADLDAAEKQLKDTILIAPFKGIIAEEPIDNYQNVQAKQKIMLLQNLSEVQIVLNVPSSDILLKRGENSKLTVTLESFPDMQFTAVLRSFSTIADPQTQTYRVVLIMKAPKEAYLLPGMPATVASAPDLEERKNINFLIPVSSVVADEHGKPFVWLVNKNGTSIQKQSIQAGEFTSGGLIVLNGLNSNDMIVSAGATYLAEGMQVRFQK